jgi:TolA-binding protein
MEDRLLAGGLYYVAGRNEDAYRLLAAAEPEVYPEKRHRWCLVAMAGALMRMDRTDEAAAVLEKLRNAYPGAAEADEVLYQFGAHYYRRRQLAEARRAFEQLQQNAVSDDYKALCDEYLVRVERLEQLKRERIGEPDTVNLPSSQEAHDAHERSPR